MFGLAAAVALSMSPAWAEPEGEDESAGGAYEDAGGRVQEWGTQKADGFRIASVAIAESDGDGEAEPSAAPMPEAGRDTRSPEESEEVRSSFEERWLRDREGYRDGGY